MKNRVLFLGSIQWGQLPTGGGAQGKNQLFLRYLLDNFPHCEYLDVWGMNVVRALLQSWIKILLAGRDTHIIVSMSSRFSTFFSIFVKVLHLKRQMYLWVVGGEFPSIIKGYSNYRCQSLNHYKKIVVEGEYIKKAIELQGIRNVVVVENFKRRLFTPSNIAKQSDGLRCVYFSRIIPEKGVDIIISAIKQLNNPSISVDFYGAMNEPYTEELFCALKEWNIHYKGFLNLKEADAYEILSCYDVMLFPTYFKGEGFPGVLIDAFMAGLPVIATDFHINGEVVVDGYNGLLIRPKDVHGLAAAINTMNDKSIRVKLGNNALKSSMKYDIDIVLPKALKSFGIE